MIKRIESRTNAHLKDVRKYFNNKTSEFLIVEGKKFVQEAKRSGTAFQEVFISDSFWEKERSWVDEVLEEAVIPLISLPDDVFASLSDVMNPQGILAVVSKPSQQAGFQIPSHYGAFLCSIRDPGNMGTIIRSGEAAGCEFMAYTEDCVDPYQAKVVRSTAGSIFRLALQEIKDPLAYLNSLHESGVSLYALTANKGANLFEAKFSFPALILLGSESHGIPKDYPVDSNVFIPMSANVESLNVAVAAAISFYTFFRVKSEM